MSLMFQGGRLSGKTQALVDYIKNETEERDTIVIVAPTMRQAMFVRERSRREDAVCISAGTTTALQEIGRYSASPRAKIVVDEAQAVVATLLRADPGRTVNNLLGTRVNMLAIDPDGFI